MALTDEQYTDESDPTLKQIEQLPRVQEFPVVGQYLLCSKLGAGGAGAVFMGYHANLQRPVAIKIMNPALVEHGEAAVARFQREAILSSQFRSDHIVPVTDAGTVYGTKIHYLIMDLVDGENAEERVFRRGNGSGLGVAEALTVCVNATRGLIEAHAQSVIHRDLKPSNIMISTEGQVRLADLGIATSLERPNLMLTQADESLGTPQYMSPEQIRGNEIDARTDVYAMGITLYYLLTAVHPFEAANAYAVMRRVESETLPDVREIREDVPAGVANLIKAATQPDIDERVPSAEALVSRIQAQLNKLGGEANLADPMAGSENRSLFVTMASEDLQVIAGEIEELQAQQEVKQRGMPAYVVVAILLLSLIGGAGVWIFLKSTEEPPVPPLDQLIVEALEEDDYPEVVELLPQAMASVDISESSRRTLISKAVESLKADYDSPVDLIELDDKGTLELFKMLSAEEDEGFRDWLFEDVERSAKKHDWSALGSLLDSMQGPNAPSSWLIQSVSDQTATELIERVKNDGWVAVDEQGFKVLERFSQADAPRLGTFIQVAKTLQDRVTSRQRTVDLANKANELGLLRTLAGDILERADQSIAQKTDASSIGVLLDLYGLIPGEANQITALADKWGRKSLDASDWDGVRTAFDIIAKADSSGSTKSAFGSRAVTLLSANVEYESTGKLSVVVPVDKTDQKATENIRRHENLQARLLLKDLYAERIKGSVLLLIELMVYWDAADKMRFVDSVSNSDRKNLATLLKVALNENEDTSSENWSRLMFLSADAYFNDHIETKNSEERLKETIRFLHAGVGAKNADCAVRLIEIRVEKDSDEAFDQWIKKYERNFPTERWAEVKQLLKQATSSSNARASSRGRALTSLTLHEIYIDQASDILEQAGRDRLADQLVDAYQSGYRYARVVAKKLDELFEKQLGPLLSSEHKTNLGINE